MNTALFLEMSVEADMEENLQRLTEGEWTVTGISLVDEKNRRIFFSAKKDQTTESHLFKVKLDGTSLKRLTKEPGSHRARVSPGGSYDGYTTCMALTYGADYFTHGYARSSVTRWGLYDTVYTERYMNRPFENKGGYKFGSAMTRSKKYKGVLFLSHGTMDDNIHMQNTTQLIDKFMDLGKKFEFMLYPNQRNGYGGKKRAHSSRYYIDFWFKHFLNR